MRHIVRPWRELRHGRMAERTWCGNWHINRIHVGPECNQCVRAERRSNGGK